MPWESIILIKTEWQTVLYYTNEFSAKWLINSTGGGTQTRLSFRCLISVKDEIAFTVRQKN